MHIVLIQGVRSTYHYQLFFSVKGMEIFLTATGAEVLPPVFKKFPSTSLIHCAMMCAHDISCGSICFDHKSKSCYKLMYQTFDFTSTTSAENNEACVRYEQALDFHTEGIYTRLYVFVIVYRPA